MIPGMEQNISGRKSLPTLPGVEGFVRKAMAGTWERGQIGMLLTPAGHSSDRALYNSGRLNNSGHRRARARKCVTKRTRYTRLAVRTERGG